MSFPSTEQAAVVDHAADEPLRVVAGAGTGKTTTMAARLERLVRDGVEPEQALGITFTNKAAEELADRLRDRLPDLAEAGRQVEVLTYHGFAHAILREYGALVGVRRDTPVVSTGSARQLLSEALGAEPRVHLDLTARPQRIGDLAALSTRLADHLLDASALLDHDDTAGAAPARRELATALAAYERRKRELGLVDYGDLVLLAHRLLVEHPPIARRIAGRYRVVLLDEYQDTNPAQRELLRVLFGSGSSVTAVGDPDQTIYEWRGASLANFARFGEHFPKRDGTPAGDRALSVNRRSGSAIVAYAEAVRSRIGAGGVDQLRPDPAAPPGRIEVARLRTDLDEAEWIAERIVRLHDEEDVAWRDIGILFRRHGQIATVREALERRDVPVEVAALGGLLQIPEVADLHAWLRVLGRPDDAPAFARLALGSTYRLGLGDLVPVSAWVRRHRRASRDDTEGVGAAILEAVDRLEDLPELEPEARRRLERFRDRYRRLLTAAHSMGLAELCRTILDETDAWLEVEALADAHRLSTRLNLYRFLDLAEAWSPLTGTPTLEAFLDHLEVLEDDDAANELDTASVGGEDAVGLLTVHRAKGLEWPVVVLPALARGIFPSTTGALPDPDRRADHVPHELRLDARWIEAPPAEAGSARTDHYRRARDAQEWRTAYVAVTRAKSLLVATSAHWYSEKQPKPPSDLHLVGRDQPAASVEVWVEDAGDPPSRPGIVAGDVPSPDPIPGGWRRVLGATLERPDEPRRLAGELDVTDAYDARMDQLRMTLDDLPTVPTVDDGDDGFRTSVTGLVTYATCPRRFFWSEVDRLPRRPSPAMRRGIELHRRIELHNRGSMALDEATEDFYDVPDRPTTGEGVSAFASFSASRFAEDRPILVEAPFELAVADARVSGRIDAVYEPSPGRWEVVDFKSGRARDDGPQRVQLQAYAVAVDDAAFSPEPPSSVRVAFVYLGDGLTEVGTDVDEAWLAAARDDLARLVAAARDEQYDPEPSEACRTCDFTRFCEPGSAWLEATGRSPR
ncbi:MAG: ATP-dependent DNA helicase [Acidimicrobiia bacterium]|nr:ATP-dependent DNA helicase [Acidimicrobiia bacterium]